MISWLLDDWTELSLVYLSSIFLAGYGVVLMQAMKLRIGEFPAFTASFLFFFIQVIHPSRRYLFATSTSEKRDRNPSHLLYNFIQFGRPCDAWRACRNFGFGTPPKVAVTSRDLPKKFRQFSAAGDEKFLY